MKLSSEQLNKLHRYNISVRGPDLKSMWLVKVEVFSKKSF